jgi:hypothetical protein
MPYRFPINDLPLTGLADLRVGFDLMSAGDVWIDRVEVYDLWLEDHERDELLKNIASAELQLDAQKLVECERFLQSPWPSIVRDLVPLEDPRVAKGPKPNNTADVVDPKAQPEKEEDRTGFLNKWRESVPRWWK